MLKIISGMAVSNPFPVIYLYIATNCSASSDLKTRPTNIYLQISIDCCRPIRFNMQILVIFIAGPKSLIFSAVLSLHSASYISDFILPTLQLNTGCFPIQYRPVFSQFWRFCSQPNAFIGIFLKFKRHRLYPENGNKITVYLLQRPTC